MANKSNKPDGRGRSAGSRTTQFSSERQPPRQSKRKQKVDPDAAELLHKAIYEKIPGLKNGKKVNVPFIEAFISSMRKNALAAKVSDQIRYFKELNSLGVFDFEDYKKRVFRGINNYYRKLKKSHDDCADLLDELGPAFKRAQVLYLFYFNAYVHARQNCTCGACDRGLDYAEWIIPIFLQAAGLTNGDDTDGVAGDETPDGDAVDGAPAEASRPIDEDGDDEFYDGFGFD